ncbi:YopX family protein [Streptococcus pneumoniae]|uniref:YopX family protein n=1 Tax=Streptococcus pneumoniae TaxID=1313 RepID=UPI00403515AE
MIPKFRAWNSETKEIEVFKTYEEISELFLVLSADDGFYSVMQSTGLFDKNNTEIFEGDIIRVLDSTYTVFYDNERGSYRLKPHDDRWNVDYMSNFSHGGNFEVVGNIYENKEYL